MWVVSRAYSGGCRSESGNRDYCSNCHDSGDGCGSGGPIGGDCDGFSVYGNNDGASYIMHWFPTNYIVSVASVADDDGEGKMEKKEKGWRNKGEGRDGKS